MFSILSTVVKLKSKCQKLNSTDGNLYSTFFKWRFFFEFQMWELAMAKIVNKKNSSIFKMPTIVSNKKMLQIKKMYLPKTLKQKT
jgi:hypothetical protein